MRHIEANIQEACVRWFRYQYQQYAAMLFAVPNGGSRNAKEAENLKRQGVLAGVSDLILLVGNGEFNALCVEMKQPTGKHTQRQKEWQKQAEKYQNKYVVCHSIEEFMDEVQTYLKNIDENKTKCPHCGMRHPLVAINGICGKCAEKLYGKG